MLSMLLLHRSPLPFECHLHHNLQNAINEMTAGPGEGLQDNHVCTSTVWQAGVHECMSACMPVRHTCIFAVARYGASFW